MNKRRYAILGAVLLSLAFTFPAWGCSAEEEEPVRKPMIKLHDPQSESQWVNNAIAEFIIEKGYGYPVVSIAETTPRMQEALPTGEIDVNLEGWQQNIIDWYNEEIQKGTIVNLGMIYEGSAQVFIIPQWVADEYGIRTVDDMKDHWKLFTDPQDPSKGAFYNCIAGWQCAEINDVKLEAYGLTDFYNVVSPASSAALKSALADRQRTRQPVFGYYWVPTALMATYAWHVLEEPPYTDDCWERVSAATLNKSPSPIERACAYESIQIEILAHSGLQQKAPDVVEMLRKMHVGLEPLNMTVAWAVENDVKDWAEAAVFYLQSFEERWKDWVTPEASEKIQKALVESPLAKSTG